MRTAINKEPILEDILQEISSRFCFEIYHIEPIKRGWLNLKWKIETDLGIYLVKQYNKERLKKYSIEELKLVFDQQNRLHHLGFPCPNILMDLRECFFQSPGGEQFIVMEYMPGETLKPGRLSEEQMYQLGVHTGRMHALLNDGSLPMKDKPEFILPNRKERIAYWKIVHKEIYQANKYDLLPVIEKQLELMEIVDVNRLNVNRIGWAHRDLWVDNILFDGDRISAILDFDRMKFDYLSLDVGRAVISGALDDDGLQIPPAKAFLKGYQSYQETGSRFLTNALTLLWFLESEWWLDAIMDKRKGPPKRFVQEMIWLSNHLLELDDMLGGI
ncbi:phosphotransferase [Paucisalibacillus sp. EB02]|uniref:phosphotransferase n=1 Tax=Paucisalibacillus sp. EB02 TaxID=1347087 RepID=UPI0004B22FEA|nr:phosphotransferase [Paucisalibacillus sp. EB02]